jgi:hypothetical protein
MKHPYFLFLLGAALLPGIAHGQFMSLPDAGADLATVRAHPLIVLLADEDPTTLRQLADKPTELAQYKAYVAQYNAQAHELAPRLWKLSPTVEFRPESDFKELRSNNKEQAVVLHYTERRMNEVGHNAAADFLGSYKARQMECELVGGRGGHILWRGSTPIGGATYASDLAITLRGLQTDLARYAAQASQHLRQSMAAEMLHKMQLTELLRTKTLLLNEADLRDQLTAAGVQALYPQAVQVVPLATIEAAVLSGDARYTYVRHLASPSGGAGPHVVDVATGEIVTARTSDTEAGITKKYLQSLASMAASYEQDAPRRAKLQQMLGSK